MLDILAWINPFDLLGLDAQTLQEILNEWGCEATLDDVKHYRNIAVPVITVLGFLIVLAWKQWKKRKIVKKWREQKIESVLGREFSTFVNKKQNIFLRVWSWMWGKNSINIYIETKFQSNPPHDKEDPEENVYSEPAVSLMDFYLNKVLIRDNKPHFLYCILAGSGMGKTTFAVNLVKRYISKYTEESKPYDIYLYSLSNENVFSNIDKISNQDKSILILDALDENNDAVKDFPAFKDKLEKAISQFRVVIITCRTQFFADEESELKQSKLAYYAKNRTLQMYHSHYIATFDAEDIENYLKQKYHSRRKRKQARRIVGKCRSLMVRPLLLSYIDDLLQYPDVNTVFVYDIYSILIDKWLDREVGFWESKKGMLMNNLKVRLELFSEMLAVEIYKKREERGGLYITANEIQDFMKEKGFTESYSYTGRSLVNRDSHGNIKFAHKSFLEYFLALQMFKGYIVVPFEGMDMVKEFYQQQCLNEFAELKRQNKVRDAYYLNKNHILIINDSTGFKHEHLNLVFSWTCLFISWSAASDTLWEWLKTRKDIKRLVIFNYDGSGTLNKILQLHQMEAVMMIGETELGKSFQKKIRNKTEAFDFRFTKTKIKIADSDVTKIMQQMELSLLMNQKVMVIEKVNGKAYITIR